jgi:ribosome-associated heat shock protein Hsp15
MRIDKWLFFTRLIKTRSQAAALVEAGEVRLNGVLIGKPAQAVKVGDELIFPTGTRRRRVVVLAHGHRRGPAPEAQALYQELEAPRPDPWSD